MIDEKRVNHHVELQPSEQEEESYVYETLRSLEQRQAPVWVQEAAGELMRGVFRSFSPNDMLVTTEFYSQNIKHSDGRITPRDKPVAIKRKKHFVEFLEWQKMGLMAGNVSKESVARWLGEPVEASHESQVRSVIEGLLRFPQAEAIFGEKTARFYSVLSQIRRLDTLSEEDFTRVYNIALDIDHQTKDAGYAKVMKMFVSLPPDYDHRAPRQPPGNEMSEEDQRRAEAAGSIAPKAAQFMEMLRVEKMRRQYIDNNIASCLHELYEGQDDRTLLGNIIDQQTYLMKRLEHGFGSSVPVKSVPYLACFDAFKRSIEIAKGVYNRRKSASRKVAHE